MGEYIFDIEHENNWLRGTQTGELSVRKIVETIEGDRVVLRSVIPIAGNNVTFIFSGVVSNDIISGDMYMGEYGTVTFIAKKNKAEFIQEKVAGLSRINLMNGRVK